MPTIIEVKETAEQLARHLGRDCKPADLDWWVGVIYRDPESLGGSKKWIGRLNWEVEFIRAETSRILWGVPNHPQKIAGCYRHLPWEYLRTIVDGRIASLWWDAPTSKIRHEWLSACSCNRQYGGQDWRIWINNPLKWVIRHLGFTGDYLPRSYRMAQWLLRKKTWRGWREEISVGYAPDGEMVRISPAEMLDEIWDEDVPTPDANPEKVVRRVFERQGEAYIMAKYAQKFPPLPWPLIPGVKYLANPRQLKAAAEKYDNCSGGYVDSCLDGLCYLVELPGSMAEIRPNGEVYQHFGVRNSAPPHADKLLLKKWADKLKK